MNDEQIAHSIRALAKQIISTHEDLLKMRASINVLKVSIAALSETDPKSALLEFEKAEKKFLEADPSVQQAQSIRELVDLLEKHGLPSHDA